MSEVEQLSAAQSRQAFGPGFFILLGILRLLFGSLFVFAEIRFRQFRLTFWGGGLVLVGATLFVYDVFFPGLGP